MRHLSNREMETFRFVNNYILENFSRHISVGEISNQVGMSEIKLYRGFKLIYKSTIIGLQTRLRMEKAATLLVTDMLVKEVAIEIGYKNSNQFGPQFKKHHGMTPTAYKALHSVYPTDIAIYPGDISAAAV